MGMVSNEELPLIYALKKRIGKGDRLCNNTVWKTSTWKNFNRKSAEGIILYGAGEMFEYFYDVYGKDYNIKYAVDKNTHTKRIHEKSGIEIYPIDKLFSETEKSGVVVCITLLNAIDEVYSLLNKNEINNCFSFGAMEYHRLSVKWKVLMVRMFKSYAQTYQLQWRMKKLEQKNLVLERRMQGIQERQSERYLYLLHTNRIINILIEKMHDDELKKEQVEYLFTNVHKSKYFPDFEKPKTFNEKIINMMLYDHNPLYTEVTDKFTLKKYVAERIGEEYVVPLLGVWDDPGKIDFASLPQQFVLKATNGGDSSKVIIVKDKSKLDIDEVIYKMNWWRQKTEDSYYYSFNGTFKNVQQRFIAEEYIGTPNQKYIYDYKLYAFHGEPKFFTLSTVEFREDGSQDIKITYMDMNWEKVDIKRNHEDVDDMSKPIFYDKIIELTRILAKPFDFVRVDFMEGNGRLYVSELTLTPGGGLVPFEPLEWDYEFGKLL